MGDQKLITNLDVPELFHCYIPAAILRIGYLYPDLTLEQSSNGVSIIADELYLSQKIATEIKYQIYREKIYAETLQMRNNLYALMATR